ERLESARSPERHLFRQAGRSRAMKTLQSLQRGKQPRYFEPRRVTSNGWLRPVDFAPANHPANSSASCGGILMHSCRAAQRLETRNELINRQNRRCAGDKATAGEVYSESLSVRTTLSD